MHLLTGAHCACDALFEQTSLHEHSQHRSLPDAVGTSADNVYFLFNYILSCGCFTTYARLCSQTFCCRMRGTT